VRSAIVNSGFGFPPGRLLVNLAPADMRKEGVRASTCRSRWRCSPPTSRSRRARCGRSSCAESSRSTAACARWPACWRWRSRAKRGFRAVIVPEANRAEAALVDGIDVYAVPTLAEAVAVVLGRGATFRAPRHDRAGPAAPARRRLRRRARTDAREARARDRRRGRPQRRARRAAGLRQDDARAARAVDSPRDDDRRGARRHEVYSIAGLLGSSPRVVDVAAVSRAASHDPRRARRRRDAAAPGEISLAQHGVLYLDELPEFSRATLEVLRQPLEEGTVSIARAAGTRYVSGALHAVASMNPCPCGFRGIRGSDCRCDDAVVQRYLGKLSGPLLDRIDLHVAVSRVSFEELVERGPADSSANIRARVEAARGVRTLAEALASFHFQLPTPKAARTRPLQYALAIPPYPTSARFGRHLRESLGHLRYMH
jgi:magnesium chelatase family protein